MEDQTERAKFACIGGPTLRMAVSPPPMRTVFIFDVELDGRRSHGYTFGLAIEQVERLHNALAIGLAAARGQEEVALRLLSRSGLDNELAALIPQLERAA